ncbi:MAG TPA: PEP-CTERM sorting domain-containing protein [Syntrophorhabdales bacterium]|nr:PEP-CTERM sorting domain-containing protein [Syntrophorhabdales bacterium]
MRKVFVMVAVFGLMLAMGSPARADSISFDLSTIANDGSGGPLHGGTVPAADLIMATVTTGVVNGSATAISGLNVSCPGGAASCFQVELQPDVAKGSTLTYVPDPVYINVNGTFTVGNPAASTFAVTGNDGIPSGPGGFDSFGTMDVGSGAAKPPEVYFWLVPTNGNSWASAANVLIPTTGYNTTYYSHGFMAEDGFFKTAIDQGSPGQSASTDAEQAGFYTPVPEPGSMLLLGAGLIGLVAVRRRLRK